MKNPVKLGKKNLTNHYNYEINLILAIGLSQAMSASRSPLPLVKRNPSMVI